ncbi:MAG: DUF488 domain-containing protein [Methanobacterium sp.]|nr:DUF488 domain-containing protein [Methanobacterium sp.]
MIYTIGHSNITQESFIELLKSFEIQLVVDVRSSPYSKFVPHFNRDNIKKTLKENNIDYTFMGNYVGGKPKDEKYYTDGKANYDLIAESNHYKEGIDKIIELNKDKNLVLMCSEEDPKSCHRHNLITQTLIKKGLKVIHIRKKGKIDKDIQITLF